MSLSDEEASALRDYLLGGGFLMVSMTSGESRNGNGSLRSFAEPFPIERPWSFRRIGAYCLLVVF